MATNQLTVAQVLPALNSGGVERGTLEIASALAAAGHRALVMSQGGSMVDELVACGAEHSTWPIGVKKLRTLRLVPKVRAWLKQQQVDVVHVRSRLPAWIVWLAWRGMNPATRPVFVTTVHGLYSVGRYSEIMLRGERVIAVSDSVRDYVQDNYPKADLKRLSVIYRGIDHSHYRHGYQAPEEWTRRWRAAYPIAPRTLTLLLPGRLTRLKGHECFLRLIKQLHTRGVPVAGLIAGGEDPRRRNYAHELYEMAAGLPVHFLGQRSDLRDLMSSVDIVLSLSSQPESFGRTVLEALSLGVPVVGFDHGGVGEILAKLYPVGTVALADEQELLQRVSELWQRPVAVAESDAFPLAEMQRATLALYEKVVVDRAN